MLTRVSESRYRFRESLFLLPLLLMSGGIVLAVIAGAVDDAAGHRPIPLTVRMNSGVATTLLTTIAGATITTAGVIFSLTVVSLQLASSQLSPRAMRWFIRDRLSQVVIGLLVATFVYCLLVLPNMADDPGEPAARVSITAAIALTVVTVGTIIIHIDHLAHHLEVGQVLREIAAEGETVAAAMVGEARRHRTAVPAPTAPPAAALHVTSSRTGWVTRLDVSRLLAAVPEHATVRLETRVGAYLHTGQPLATVWPVPAHPDRVRRRVVRAVTLGSRRTMEQDVDFALRQLVDIGLRALSAAVNDPTTAVGVIHQVGRLLRPILVAPAPPAAIAGSDGRMLLRPWDLDAAEYIAHGFDQLRHAANPQPVVVAALLRVLRMLTDDVRRAGRYEHLPALREQIDLLCDTIGDSPAMHPRDLQRLRAVAYGCLDSANRSYRRLTP